MAEKDDRVQDYMLVKALKAEHGVNEKEVVLKDWKTMVGGGTMDNFATDMVAIIGQASVQGKHTVFSYMAKVLPNGAMRHEMVKKMEIFDKEYFLYSVIIPMANKAREEHGLKPIKVPKCLYAEGDPGILIMNNLKDKGFGLIKSREDGFAEDELKVFVEAIAEFHASNYHIMKSHPGGKDVFLGENKMLKEMKAMDPGMMTMWKQSIEKLVDTFAMIVEEHHSKELADKIYKYKPHAFFAFFDAWMSPFGNFTTIVHGDAWANNAMFKHDSKGNTEDFVLIDFQMCKNTSPALDLSYALTTCTDGHKRIKELPRWQRIYYDKLRSDMKVFGYDTDLIYPFDDFLKDYDHYHDFAVAISLQHAMFLLKKEDDYDVADLKEAEVGDFSDMYEKSKQTSLRQARTNDAYRERLVSLAIEADARKMFDKYM